MKNVFECACVTHNLSSHTLRSQNKWRKSLKGKENSVHFYCMSLLPLNIHLNTALPCIVDTTVALFHIYLSH